MALFVTKEGKRKSPMAVTCFFVDLLFCLVFGGMYALLTGVLHDNLPLGGGGHCGLLHPVSAAGQANRALQLCEPAGYHDHVRGRSVPAGACCSEYDAVCDLPVYPDANPCRQRSIVDGIFQAVQKPDAAPPVKGSSMEKLTKECVLQSAARLEQESQDAVMRDIPQFFEAEIVTRFAGAVPQKKELNPLVFNMERGICLAETVDFLRECPALRPYDLILANELDSGCARSGERDTAAEIARALGMQYVFGLEFVELKDAAHGFHGNAIFSRWPILWAEVRRLPEQYNWYYDRQKRIGGRNAVFAKLDVQGQEVGAVSIHLENRTSGAGRLQQMKAVLQEVERVFPGIPVVLGGDLNTNTFDGRDKAVIRHLCDEPEELAQTVAGGRLPAYEAGLVAAARLYRALQQCDFYTDGRLRLCCAGQYAGPVCTAGAE